MSDATHIVHPIPPLYDAKCKILILGSFPSVKSREAMFFYGHPQNRYWKLIARLFDEPVPETIEEKKHLVLSHHIAMWDTIYSCMITGSSDSSIREVVPNDLSVLLDHSMVEKIFCNGATSHKLYMKYLYPVTRIEAVKLPSTSPANAAYSLDKLAEKWSIIREFCISDTLEQ